MADATIDSSWNGEFIRQGNQINVTPPNWAQVLQPNQTNDSVGFCARKTGTNYRPTAIEGIPN
jgi:hypothetical protein